MIWLDAFIRENGLKYYLFAGSALGARRHNGFIPWDDDIDIVLPREDYAKLCQLLRTPIDHYVIENTYSESKEFLYTYAKFYDLDTSMTEILKKKLVRGVFIDIFPLDGIGNTKKEALQNYRKIDFFNMLLATRTCVPRAERKWYKNLAIRVMCKIPHWLIDDKRLAIKIDEENQKHPYDEMKYVGVLMSTYRSKDIHLKELFGTPTEYSFEGHSFFGPEKIDDYLKEEYGEWQKLPSEDKRHSAHDFIDLDLNKSYITL